MEFPNSKMTKFEPCNVWTVGKHYGRATYQRAGKPSAGWRKYLIKELSKVEGGLDGITLNGGLL